MGGDELIAFLARRYDAGRSHFEAIGGVLARCCAPQNVYPPQDFHLEPLLFAHGMARAPSHEFLQIVCGYLPERDRPEAFAVLSDHQGVVSLPRLGFIHTATPDRAFVLTRDVLSQALEKRETVDDAFELDIHVHPTFARLWPDAIAAAGPPLARPMTSFARPLARALAIVRDVYPEYWQMIAAVTRRIVLLERAAMNSFASNAAFGAVFLNVLEDDVDEVFFIEDIVHQCGHVLFNAATHETADFLAVAPDAMLAGAPGEGETRTVYGALHGLFTEAVMNLVFERCLAREVFAGRQRHELLGRYALIYRRFNYDLLGLCRRELYTHKGARIFEWCRGVFEHIRRIRGPELLGHDYSGQPYAFNYEIYRARNPLVACAS